MISRKREREGGRERARDKERMRERKRKRETNRDRDRETFLSHVLFTDHKLVLRSLDGFMFCRVGRHSSKNWFCFVD